MSFVLTLMGKGGRFDFWIFVVFVFNKSYICVIGFNQ